MKIPRPVPGQVTASIQCDRRVQRGRIDVEGGTARAVIELASTQPPRQRQYAARAYGPCDRLPARWWRKITLHYPGGRTLVLIYPREPADPAELPELMWQLQRAAGRHGFRVTVTEADGCTAEAPPIPARRGGAR